MATNKEMINKFKDMADCADAAYAKLDYVYKYEKDEIYDGWFNIKRWQFGDNIRLGYEKDNGYPTAYALSIEARFSQDSYFNEKLVNNDIFSFINEDKKTKKLSISITPSQISLRTKNFVKRFKLLNHISQENAFSDSGFSATLFEDTQATSEDSEYIFAIRGSNEYRDYITDLKDIFMGKSNPKEQYFDMLLFYKDCIKKGYITESTPLVIVGHSLGGALAQLFALSMVDTASKEVIQEVYTFNAPGAKTLQVPYNINPMPHYIIHLTKEDLSRDENINYKLNVELGKYFDTFKYQEQNERAKIFKDELYRQLWDKSYDLKKEQGNQFYLGIYFDPLNEMLPYVSRLEKQEDYRYLDVLEYYYCLYKNYKERKVLASYDSTYHLETKHNSGEFIPILGYPNNATQHLWTNTDGYHYAINIGGIMGIPSHFLTYSVRTLYLYSYLLELDSNNEMIESKLNTQDKKEKLQKYIHELNVFMDNIRLSMNILINEIDKENVKKYEKYKQNTKWYQTTPKYEEVDFLPLFISQINEKAYKIESLKQDNNQYFQSNINKEEMIDSILKLQEKSYLIEMFDIDKLKELRNNCKADKKSSITEKLSLATCQPFELVNSQNMALINKNNVNSIFGYLHLGYLLTQEWHEEYINGRYKIMKGLYFNGKTSSSFSQYMIKRDDEKEAINH